MSSDYDLNLIAEALQDVLVRASDDDQTSASDLRQVLVFVSDVARVVDLAFSNVRELLIPYVNLEASELTAEFVRIHANELQLLQTRTFFRDAGNICGQLGTLRETFEVTIAPIVGHLPGYDQWGVLFRLLHDREGQIVQLMGQAVSQIAAELYDFTGYPGFSAVSTGLWYADVPPGSASVNSIRRRAATTCREIAGLLDEMRTIKNNILGLSGRPGLLALLETDRNRARASITHIFGEGAIVMGNSYQNFGTLNQSAFGEHAEVRSPVSTCQDGTKALDLPTLAIELRKLAEMAATEAKQPEEYSAAGSLREAEAAAVSGDENKTLEHLKAAGSWGAEVATKIGTSVAAEVIKHQLGIH